MAVTFVWMRKINLGLILITFGIMVLSQLPILFHIREFTALAVEKNYPFLLGGMIGIAAGLTTATAILTEHYSQKGRANPPILLLSIYAVLAVYFAGYFIIFQHLPNYVKELQVEDFYLFFWSQIGALILAFLPAGLILERARGKS
ncbi:MAG: hypothetical protein ACFFCQ_10980 [Promethearchaeota archaeon]